jgi:hypothetical protein
MAQTYLIAKATNQITKQTVMHKDLNGSKFTLQQRKLAQDFADQYAEKLTDRWQQPWTGYVVEYVPGIVKA